MQEEVRREVLASAQAGVTHSWLQPIETLEQDFRRMRLEPTTKARIRNVCYTTLNSTILPRWSEPHGDWMELLCYQEIHNYVLTSKSSLCLQLAGDLAAGEGILQCDEVKS